MNTMQDYQDLYVKESITFIKLDPADYLFTPS